MVRPSVGFRKGDQQELKTLKLPKSTLEVVRQPNIWSRPPSGLYDYHYEIGGLYYQPMLNYCIERGQGAERRHVDMPDRLMSNFDKRAFVPSGNALDYEDFLTTMYRRKIRVDNTKTIDCGNKLHSMSKENTKLNDYRSSAQQRDKYVCQIQMHHTGNVANKENLRGKMDLTDEEASIHQEEEKEKKMTVLGINKDDRYGPAFTKVSSLNSHKKSWDPLEEFYSKQKEDTLEKRAENVEASSLTTQTSSSKVTRIVNGEVIEHQFSEEAKFKPSIKKEMLEAETLGDWLKYRVESGAKRVEKRAPKPQYIDTGYAKALDYVQDRVRKAGLQPGEQKMNVKNFKYFYGDRKAEDVGKYSKAAINSHMMSIARIPDFDVGYDTINTIKDARVIR